MPKKLLALVVLMAIGLALDGTELVLTEFPVRKLIVSAVHVALLIGVVRGNEGTRGLMIVLGWLGLGASLLLGARLLSLDVGRLFDVAPLLASISVGGLLFGVAFCAYMIWCLGQDDVKRWMYRRSMGGGAEEG